MHLLYVSDVRVDAYLVKALREAGHLVEIPDDPADGVAMAADGSYEAIIVDWSSSAMEAVARFAAVAASALVVVIIVPGQESEQARLLEAGADACFTRPAQFIELEERLKALRRLMERTRAASGAGAVEMAPAIQAVRLNGQEIVLSRREFRVMAVLAAHAGEVVGFDQLLQQAWGDAGEPRLDLLKACLLRLRRKLDAAGASSALKLVSGHGYVLRPPMAASPDAAPAKMKIF
jgi:two-component system OmpR family response regulator